MYFHEFFSMPSVRHAARLYEHACIGDLRSIRKYMRHHKKPDAVEFYARAMLLSVTSQQPHVTTYLIKTLETFCPADTVYDCTLACLEQACYGHFHDAASALFRYLYCEHGDAREETVFVALLASCMSGNELDALNVLTHAHVAQSALAWALCAACMAGNCALCGLLLLHGATGTGEALCSAARAGHQALCHMLLEACAMRQRDLNRALVAAVDGGDAHVCALLRSYGAAVTPAAIAVAAVARHPRLLDPSCSIEGCDGPQVEGELGV